MKPKKVEMRPLESKPTNDTKVDNFNKQNDKLNKSKAQKKEIDRKMKEHDNAKELEDLKMKQNAELLELLNTEQKIEEEREKMLEKVTEAEERKRLERIFGIERAKASERIIKLSEKHEKALKEIKRK